MSNILFDLSGKIKEPSHIDALFAIKKVADSLSIPFFIVGASARDYIFEHCYNIKSPRITTDIDLGVEVSDWDQFNKLTTFLISTGKFANTRRKERLLFGNVSIDIIPFGSIAGEHKRISWPPEQELIMNMLGFQEAYEYSITVRLNSNPDLDIKLPTLPGLALMKIISWKEKYPSRQKDAEDLLFIMNKYEDTGNRDRLYNEEQSLLQEEGFDNKIAGIRLLGRDMAKMADLDTVKEIKSILDKETEEQDNYRLVTDMIMGLRTFREKFDEILNQLIKLKQGFIEI
ncbi:MAG: nucleotidyl transferase AbiEii/AbiGii toxin family protein [Candidatus Schekmanbacteria bacterium]|nr:nucleotidyl transferase AbiEii/AbiGii toxin family protein [Candidatus Schekmanbacteria bacterium]